MTLISEVHRERLDQATTTNKSPGVNYSLLMKDRGVKMLMKLLMKLLMKKSSPTVMMKAATTAATAAGRRQP